VCGTMCDMCWLSGGTCAVCLVAPEMSELQRCPEDAAFGVGMVSFILYIGCIYMYICMYINKYIYIYIRRAT